MDSNYLGRWHEYPQKKVKIKFSQRGHSPRKPGQSEGLQTLQKKQAELEWLRTLYESIPCISFILDSTGIIRAVSQFGANYLDYGATELTQKSVSEVFYEEDKAQCHAKLSEVQQQPNQISQWEARLVRKNRTSIWVKAIARLIPGTEAKPQISLVCEDITAHKQLEETLRESEELYRSTLGNIADTVLITDNRGAFTFICPNVEVIFGYSQQEVGELGNIAKLLGEEVLDWQALETTGEIHNIERKIVDKTGRRHTLLVNVKRVSIQGGTVLYSCRDISARKQAEDELRQCHDQLEYQVGERTAELVSVNARLEQEISDRQQVEETLRQQFLREQLIGAIAGRIHESLNLEEILNTTVAEVRQSLECDRVIIFHLHADGSGVVVVESVEPHWIPISGVSINDRYFAESYVELYKQGRVQAVENIYSASLTPCHVELLAQFQVRANLVVPIVHEEKLWGLLVAQQCSRTREWQLLEIDLLKSLATQAAIAIHQSELYQQAQTELAQRQHAEAALRQQFQREQLVGAIAQRIRQSLKLEEILNATVAEVRQFLACDRVLIYRVWSNGRGSAVTEAVVPGWPAILGQTFPEEVFPEKSQQLYSQGRILAIDDIEQADVLPCLVGFVQQFGVKAKLVVPILQEKSLWGLLVAHHCSNPRQWQPTEIDLLKSLATQVAIALQQSQLYEQAQSQAKRERAINQVTQAIRSSLDLTTVFETAVREIGELLDVDRAKIVQYLPERQCWLHVSEYCKSKDAPDSLGEEIPDENNPIAERLKRLKVVRIQDTQTLDDEINKGLAEVFPGAWLMVPLHFGSRVLGSLTLARDIYPYHWQDSEVELIRGVADQVAIALQQAELYQQSCTATARALTQAEQLEQALQELRKTQAHLVQSEKMSSLGQLVAGVAHEINNPVSFIYGNLVHAHGYTQDILDLIELYQKHYPNPVPEIQSEIEAIDLDFLLEDLPKLLDSMKVGAERICEIITSLRTFSRVAEAEIKAVDIHEGLDSTLTILQNRLKAQGKRPGIQVIKEYGNLPKVECYAGQLNQVFMNLLTNAIDALEELAVPLLDERENDQLTTDFKPMIQIRTELTNDNQVVIRIADNGVGIKEHVKARIFDPFFTTKPVGVGTGLGLSISYQIVVEKHRGQLHCFSEQRKGTEFLIQIPLWQSAN